MYHCLSQHRSHGPFFFFPQNEVERNITILTEKNEEIKNVLSRMENREEVDIDEAVVPTAPLYRQ